MLKIDQKAPEILLQDQDDQLFTLSSYQGQKVVVYFYPKDNTPGCTKQAIAFSEKISEFIDLNTLVVGVSKDSIKSHQNFSSKHHLNIKLLSDPDGVACNDYGVWQEKSMYGKTYMGIQRATFLINEKGDIVKIWPKVKVKDHVDDVLNQIRS
ncbi:thioredoxin-dependent thiol peroxidase [Candidatus Marinamargulisbacteria bacterium SCGC AG-414-C22]|nr:thioredoxin-dependent thiol peroxidase [Candidatus Marinamargulisbacteria bacterium SCGC AG-414-C22]